MKAVFVDKDGTLIEDIPYNVDPDLITFVQGAIEGLKMLQSEGFKIIIVTNQSGIARGYFSEQELMKVRERLEMMLASEGVYLDGFYYCPHHPQGEVETYRIECLCRKPMPGMLKQAANDLNISLSSSWMVGDILDDVEAGNRAGCRSILIDNGNETKWETNRLRIPYAVALSMNEAADLILQNIKRTDGVNRTDKVGLSR